MKTYSYLMATAPFGERCAQVGEEDYMKHSLQEATAYMDLLKRLYGENPPGTHFKLVKCEHDAGAYRDIRFYYDDEQQSHVIYLDNLERGVEKWDEPARNSLAKLKYKLPPEKVIPITRSYHYQDKAKGA